MISTKAALYNTLKFTEKHIWYIIKNIAKHYKEKEVDKTKYGKPQLDKNGSIRKRNLRIPTYPLDRIQKTIHEFITAQSAFPDYMYGSIRGRNHIQNAFRHCNNVYFLKVDLKNFFPNISHRQVYGSLVKFGLPHDIARIVTPLTTVEGKLPQGAPTSCIIANLVLQNVARRLHDFARTNNLTFTCYLDDLTFSSKEDFRALNEKILNIIKEEGFFPSPKKISYRKISCEITGIIVKNNTLDLIHEMKREALTNLHIYHYYMSFLKQRDSLFNLSYPNTFSNAFLGAPRNITSPQ
nr:reverse transcriptase family protein [Niabella hibiscisoli]